MNNLSLTGTVAKVGATKQITDTFKKRALLIVDKSSAYENIYFFEATQDRVSILDNLKEGQEVTVHFNVRCNEHNGRYFTNLQCWKVDTQSGVTTQQVTQSTPAKEQEEDDLPF